MTEMETPLDGLTVLDMSQGVAGPHCAWLLGLQGADVIKVEPPGGDWVRPLGKTYGEQSCFGVSFTRGKRSIVLDLKKPEAVDVIRTMAKDVDVVLESSRPGVADRLGIGYKDLSAVNPALIYVSVTGYGQTGPNAKLPCTDGIAQAFSGFMADNFGPDGIPHRVNNIPVDVVTGLYAVNAVFGALMGRMKHGRGRFLDISLMQSIAAFTSPKIAEAHLVEKPMRTVNVPSGIFKTKDGWIVSVIIKNEDFPGMCQVMGLPELADDPRFATFESRAEHEDDLMPVMRARKMEKTTAEWEALYKAADMLCEPVNTYRDWLSQPQVTETDAAPLADQPEMGRVPLPRLPGVDRSPADLSPAPLIGEQGEEILRQFGYDDQAIDRLASAEAVSFRGEDK